MHHNGFCVFIVSLVSSFLKLILKAAQLVMDVCRYDIEIECSKTEFITGLDFTYIPSLH